MNKPYLLIAGDCYYPHDTLDWVGCFSTYEEAREQVEPITTHDYYTQGKNKGEIKSTRTTYVVKGEEYGARTCDWYEIVDLKRWTQ
jgi:hypothetical protein